MGSEYRHSRVEYHPRARVPGGFPLAGLRDLAAMKLSAIAKRGVRRDFWDLHEIISRTEVSLQAATLSPSRRGPKV